MARTIAGTTVVCVLLLAVTGCQTVPSPSSPDEREFAGIVVVSVKVRLPKRLLRFGAETPDGVFMYRLEGDAPPFTPGALVWSDLELDGHTVFLAVPPGRYAVAGAVKEVGNTIGSGMTPVGGGVSVGGSVTLADSYHAYFSDELLRSLVVDVGSESVAVLGEVDVEMASITEMDEAQRYAKHRIAPDHEPGARDWFSTQKHYTARVRHKDRSQPKVEEIAQDVREALVEAGWSWQAPSGATTVAAVDYLRAEPSYPAGSGPQVLALRVVDDVRSETSQDDVANLEALLAAELAAVGLSVTEDPTELAIDVEVHELTSGSGRFSLRNDSAAVRYTVTAMRAGDVLSRSNGEHQLGEGLFDQNEKELTAAATRELLVHRSAGDIADFAQGVFFVPAEAIASWLSRPAIQIVLKDQVGTVYSKAGTADFRELLEQVLRNTGYRLEGGPDALTPEVDVLDFHPGSRAKRIAIGFGVGASNFAYQATVRNASGRVLGTTEGRKRYTGMEITDSPELKSHRRLRVDMADHCAEQISEYVQTLGIARRPQVAAP